MVKNLQSQKGQALLIVVLVMVIALTVTLSIVSRSVVNLRTSVEQSESQKALAAAEAGVEQAIKNNASIGVDTPASFGNTTYTATISDVLASSSFLLNGGIAVTKSEGSSIWLSTYNEANPWSDSWSGNLDIYWGDPGAADSANAALEIVLLSGPDKNSATVTRYAVDPDGTRRTSNNFANVAQTGNFNVGGKSLKYRYTISVVSGFLVRVTPVYTSSYIGAQGTNLPTQGKIVTASGTSGNTQRKVTVFQGYPILPPELFLYSLLSL
ncbi:MAG: hypothetical protein HY344_01555 [Candidatus Levybacteria bacterium]|nr:hypothetical protein [Candidatus Levybacteria bacterium]